MRRVVLVLEGGDLAAAFAISLASSERIASVTYVHRRDGNVQVMGLARASDGGARERWAKRCRRAGLTVARAPWEKERKSA